MSEKAMSIQEQIAELVDKYEGLNARRLKQFNEENTKKDFILPLFRHLGWDVTNSDEVAAEEKSSNGRVDYAFKLGGVSKFYLEAKPLREDLNQRPDWAKQVITYAENKGVTWAVLTNFKQLMVFNAEWDKPALERARFLNLTYQEYLPAFHKLWWLSRDSLEKGVLDEEARQVGALKPKLPVEKSLLDQLLRWRGELFNQIYQHNKDRGLDLYQVDELIQQFINRLIFIRSAEDRGIEENRFRATLHQWRDSGRQGELVERMRAIFHEFATLYDSDLFPVLDTWDSVFVDGVTIAEIIEGSYERPNRLAGYDFAAIDPKVMGAVYEQYLGYVAQVAKEEAKKGATQARLRGLEAPAFELEARRIKRKQQGIYYTPEFVTDYIVKETVGRFIKEHSPHSPNDIFNIKILDPACGSGSFLIRAYDELLHYHARQQGKSPAELDHWERLSILNRNIFGVDLDRQAVEITRLSLLLSCVAQREILPSLADNIRQGNSLISGTEEELKKYFGDNWRDKKPFNWEWEFKDIMAQGGFDMVIGNPPYVNEARGNKELFRELKPLPKLRVYYEKNMDLFNFFIEVGLDLLKEGGFLGYIIPTYWQDRTSATILRKNIIEESNIERLVDLGEFKVFEEAPGQHNNILVLQKVCSNNKTCILSYIEAVDSTPERKEPLLKEPKQLRYALSDNKLIIGDTMLSIVQKLGKEPTFHLHKEEVVRGVDTSPSRYEGEGVFVLSETEFLALSKELTSEQKDEFFRQFYEARQIDRYYYEPTNHHWLIYTDARRKQLLENSKDKYKVIVNHLDKFGDVITSDNKPYGLHRAKQESNFLDKDKLLFVRKTPYPKFVPISIPYFVDEAVYLIIWHRPLYSFKYLLAIFNSKLAGWWFGIQKRHGGQLQIDKEQILSFPIRAVDFDNPTEKKRHDDLVALVSRMLELNKRLAPIRNTPSTERDELLREIKRTDAEIDQIVYKLYGLTEEERQVIETSLVSEASNRSGQVKSDDENRSFGQV